MKKDENKIFAEGFCFKKIFIFFLIGGLFGTYYEEILWFIKYGEITSRQGLIYTPFSPIYGLGVIVFVIFLGKKNKERSLLETFIFASLIGGVTEYMTSLIADVCFGVKFWDYSNYFLNLNGRTTIPFMLGWGLLGTFLMKVLYPFVSKWVEKIPYRIGNFIYYFIFVVVILDLFITYSAFGRMGFRNAGVEPFTPLGQLYDEIYDNEFMYEKFPVMRPDND